MAALSDKIIKEIDIRHPKSQEEHERNGKEYIEYFLDVHEKVAKKGRSTAYDEVDRFVNKTTDESIITDVTTKVIKKKRRNISYLKTKSNLL